MRKDTIFKLGDRVYAPFHGYGVVTAIHDIHPTLEGTAPKKVVVL